MNTHRYIRQTSLQDFGSIAQQKLADASVLVVGVGGLGIPVLQYLNAMGVGTLGMVEQDCIDLTNLQRQVLYNENDIGKPKLEVALEKLKLQNSQTQLKAHAAFLNRDNALQIISDYDLVVDASDNFPTRYLINDACVILKKPFVYGALHSFEGQVSVFNYNHGPTYRCLFPKMPSGMEIPNCNDNGVLGVIPGIVGNLQALEAIKVITGIGEVLSGKLLLFSGLNHSFQKINFLLKPENLLLTVLEDSYETDSCIPVRSITVNELQELIKSDTAIQVVDVRSTTEYATYHLPNSINIPLEELENRVMEINLKQSVYLICQSGRRSAMAQDKLSQISPNTNLYNIFGGINTLLTTCF
ncbi:MAG: HesA/MoeB/ThiF family protein [Bacteroidota bacterium]